MHDVISNRLGQRHRRDCLCERPPFAKVEIEGRFKHASAFELGTDIRLSAATSVPQTR